MKLARPWQPKPLTTHHAAARFPRYGYQMLHAMLKMEGLVVTHKKTYSLYCEGGL